jgi:hypothetical protein
MPVKKEYAVLRDWTFSPRPNVVQAFKAGTIAKGLTRRCVIAGIAANALQPLNAHPALGQGAD